MSIKTLKKRIALVAVTALTAGVFSVATAPIARAAAGDLVVELGTGAGTGICSVSQSSAFTTSLVAARTSTLAAPVTVTMAVGGTLGYSKPITDKYVTWPSNGVMTHATAGTLHSNYGVYGFATGGSTAIDATATQLLTAAAVGTFTVKSYDAALYSAVNTVNTSATQIGSFTVSVVATCASTGYSATYSAIQTSGAYNASPSNTTADVLVYAAGTKAYINIIGKNGYNAALPASTVWAASATNGAKVSIGTSSAISASTTADGANSFTSTAAAGTNVSVRVGAPSGAALSTVVTVTADGAAVTTESITFQAAPEKLVLLGSTIGKISSASEGSFVFQLQDAAGTPVAGAAVTGVASTYGAVVTGVTIVKEATTIASDMSPGGETVNGVDLAVASGGSSGSSTSTNGTAKFACNAAALTPGTASIGLQFTHPITEATITTTISLKCAGGVSTYTISTDKAVYKIGDVMDITVTALASGNVAPNDFVFFTANELSVGGGSPIVNTTTADSFVAGVKKFKAQVTTAGSFNVVLTHAGSTTKSATAAFTVSPASGTTNEDVLKAIVSLIASINKQIQALQKLILKR